MKARPLLMRELGPALKVLTLGKSWQIEDTLKHSLRMLWQYLDKDEGASGLRSVKQLPRSFGGAFRLWLMTESRVPAYAQARTLNTIRRLFTAARQLLGVDTQDLPWPSIPRPKQARQKDVEPRDLKALYASLKSWHWNFRTTLEEGRLLRATGVDPRSVGDGRDREAWSRRENQAVLSDIFITELTLGRVAGVRALDPWFEKPECVGLRLDAPDWPTKQPVTPFDRSRWSVPLFEDVAAAVSLVVLHTGWNIDTALNLDVSSEARWFDRRTSTAADGASVAIYAIKRRTGREQIATSLVRPYSHPFAVIDTMRTATEPLRQAVRHQLAVLEAGGTRVAPEPELSKLRAMLRSPWLYLSRNGVGAARVGWVSEAAQLARTFQQFAEEASALAGRRGADASEQASIKSLRLSDMRDGYAAFLNDGSLFNTFLVKRALGHTKLRTTMRYLDKRRDILRRYRDYARFQEILFDEIESEQRLDSTVLVMRTKVGAITDEQRARLRDHRQRTRMGMGCLDPLHPPVEIAPEHAGGLCSVQRCTLCRHGVVFPDSWPSLATRAAELEFIRGRTPQDRFVGSSFHAEWIAIESLMERMDSEVQTAFASKTGQHLDRLKAGSVYLFEQVVSASS